MRYAPVSSCADAIALSTSNMRDSIVFGTRVSVARVVVNRVPPTFNVTHSVGRVVVVPRVRVDDDPIP